MPKKTARYAPKNKGGRPKITNRETEMRSKMIGYYLTPDDARNLEDFAKVSGFRSTGQLTTAIMERLLIGGFAPLCFAKIGLQIQAFAQKNGNPFAGGFYFGIRPLPALPDEHISSKESRALAAELIKEATSV